MDVSGCKRRHLTTFYDLGRLDRLNEIGSNRSSREHRKFVKSKESRLCPALDFCNYILKIREMNKQVAQLRKSYLVIS